MTNILDIQKKVKIPQYQPEEEPKVKPHEPQFMDHLGRPLVKRYPMSPKHRKRLARQRKNETKETV